jgi:cation/acetate symporter
MYGGLIAAIGLIVISPVFSGGEKSMIPGIDIAIFPLNNPGIISIPLGFLLGWIGTVTAKSEESRALAAEMEVRSLTGFGAEKAVEH